jgi:arylsulfatase A-like enzyme/Flp pilus assembly protein TadD
MSILRLAFILAAVVLSSSGLPQDQASPPRPNVVLIVVDTLRADRLSCYGYNNIETPSIDALARDGILFDQAIAQVPLTWPSHAAIFTGTYPFHNGVQDFTGQPLGDNFRTLAQSLKAHGYATGAVVSSFVLDRSWGLGRGFDFYQDSFAGLEFVQKDIALVDRRAEESVDEALGWLEGVDQSPFFLWLHLFDPHSAYDPPEPFRSRYRQRPYDGEVAYVDSQVARLLDRLKDKGLYDDTIIVFLSDHGESLGEHGENEHGFFVYNSTLRVPLIIKPPSDSPLRPRRIAAPVETISVAPTILQLAAIQDPIHNQFQARSLVALMSHGQAREGRAAYGETFYPFSSFGWSPLRGLQTARYHYIEAPEPELYDLQADAQEKKNLAGQEKKVAAALKGQLLELVGRYPAPMRDEAGSNLTPEETEKLRALGYVAYRAPIHGSFDPEQLSDPKRKLREFNAILQATGAFSVGDYATGSALLKKVQKTEPELYLVYFLSGKAASMQGDWGTARKEFEKTLELNPNFDQAMMGLARALHRQGESIKAKQWLRQALAINPRNFRAWYELARVQAKDSPASAMASLEKTLAIQPNFALAFRERGLLRMKEQQYAAASRDLEKAVELGMDDPTTYNYLGISYSRTNRLELAVSSYQRALAADPDLAEAHLNLAYAYHRLGQTAEARQEYVTACRLEKKLCQYVPGLKE